MSRTQEERKAETRRLLLDAAADEFGAKGFHGVSADSVADAADRTSGAVYAHFGNKVGLVLALLAERSLETGRRIKASMAEAGDTDERLDALWRSFIDDASREGSTWMLLEHELWLFAARNPEARHELAQRFASAREAMSDSFAGWAEASAQPLPLPADDLATLVFALLMGLEMQHRVDPDAVPAAVGAAGLRQLFAPSVDTSTGTSTGTGTSAGTRVAGATGTPPRGDVRTDTGTDTGGTTSGTDIRPTTGDTHAHRAR